MVSMIVIVDTEYVVEMYFVGIATLQIVSDIRIDMGRHTEST